MRVGVILAGGRARRMGGVDKGAVMLAGRRLIDHVLARLRPQTDEILIVGPHGYGAGCPFVPDREDGPNGPAAGLWAAAHWLRDERPSVVTYVTAPVDAPFLPADLAIALSGPASSTVAATHQRLQPTFAHWRVADVERALSALGPAPSLHALAGAVDAVSVAFPDPAAFMNVNTPADLAEAERALARADRTAKWRGERDPPR